MAFLSGAQVQRHFKSKIFPPWRNCHHLARNKGEWLETRPQTITKTFKFQLVIMPQSEDGLILYSGKNDMKDFISLHLNFGELCGGLSVQWNNLTFRFFKATSSFSTTWDLV